ncbi:MAG: uracil-DNA glycosylase [Candidatus Nomurabacteria bacterium]|jgi:uracil-DNA glycosylase|nr:uracil-DNA glycosylase [Candidatus Nomurabacteria bacterium]
MTEGIIGENWRGFLAAEVQKPYFRRLAGFLDEAYATKCIFPARDLVFSAFRLSPEKIRVVILGQDPYHGEGQAHGLAFSVQAGVAVPPSLRNIYKEIAAEFGGTTADEATATKELATISKVAQKCDTAVKRGGNLENWAEQGVFLLNSVLTVEAGKAGSHRGLGWEVFAENVVRYLAENRSGLVFLLWGNAARAKKPLIDGEKHLVLEATHPSPLSAYRGFFGCGHFKKANEYLVENGQTPINW